MEKEETKITLGLIISWILGVLVSIAGVGLIFTEPVPGILFILLHELKEDGNGSVSGVVDQLSASNMSLMEMQKTISLLREEMRFHMFEDLPTLQETNLEELGTTLLSAEIIDNIAWMVISDIMREHGFYGILDFFCEEVNSLQQKTKELITAIQFTEQAAKAGQLNLVLEQNQTSNFKAQFARLYSAWHQFQQKFLASSMLSTELWYRYCNAGSLLEQRSAVRVA